MKDMLFDIVAEAQNPWLARHRIREFLQVRLLHLLQRQGAMSALAFHGGTALRILFHIPRFSEDLDFTLEGDPYRPERYAEFLASALRKEGYAVRCRLKTERPVHALWVRFVGLLHELGLSPHHDEVLAIKIEVDTRPPRGVQLQISTRRRFAWLLRLQHHNLASILAGKIHALLQRPYLKGRDVYDLIWLRSRASPPEPNLDLLRHALQQTGWPGPEITQENWRLLVWQRLAQASWEHIRKDVEPFLEHPDDRELLTPEILREVLLLPE